MRLNRQFFGVFILILTSCGVDLPPDVQTAYQTLPELIDYNFHIKPILSDRCYSCHGPDENSRKADLRLDLEEEAFATLESGGHAFAAGNIGGSNAIQRMLSLEESEIMPPPDSKLTLSPTEIATIVKWVEQGAEWKAHWSFSPPTLPEIPENFPDTWTTINPVDNFILEKINQAELKPSGEAKKERLLKRVSMDLTGLPPTIDQIDDFLNNKSPEAYEKVVDRLLNTDQFGERMAMEWMDVARYADSHGMHADGWRMMWPWRDWVIKAFNENMPYNDFVTWQMAGDLFPNATKEQILATAFHRNHPMTAEGGAIDEEFRLEYVADRTNTTATAFMGLTMECAKCHDHKFDPISQEEYYMMSAFFNNVKELGMTGDDGNFGPMLLMADNKTDAQIADLDRRIKQKEEEIKLSTKSIKTVTNFVESVGNKRTNGLIGYYPFEYGKALKVSAYSTYQGDNKPKPSNRYVLDGNKRSYTQKEAKIVEGKVGNSLKFDGEYDEVYLTGVGTFELNEQYSASAWIRTSQIDSSKTQVIFGTAGEKNMFWRGWDFYLKGSNQLSLRLIHSLPHNYIQVTTNAVIKREEWTHVAFTYDGSSKANGVRLFINGNAVETIHEYDQLYKSIKPVRVSDHILEDRPIRVAKSYRSYTGENGIFNGQIDEIRLYNKMLSTLDVSVIADAPLTQNEQLLAEQTINRSKKHQKEIAQLSKLRKDWLDLMMGVPEVMVMEEMPEPRSTFLLNRGQYDSPLKAVKTGTPEQIMSFPDDLPKNRFGLAQWLFNDQNPLTSRVTVNRYWQLIFGRGIVKTLNDFGSQGALPTHPELLDWLAIDFMNSGWDLKKLIKTMVTSRTYKQSSVVDDELVEKDPENILLARAPSYRLSAEMIRDNALAASGLLSKKIGGKSVKPYQPDSLWIELGNFSYMLLHYKQDSGQNLYRRSLYTFIRRTSPPPYMTTFDAPNRDICTVQRERTNTPLQALILLNDPQFVEASRILAERIQNESGSDLPTMISHAFRLATGRSPEAEEISVLERLYHKEKDRFDKSPNDAMKLLSVGEMAIDRNLNNSTTAALAMVTSTILNHDDAYMKR